MLRRFLGRSSRQLPQVDRHPLHERVATSELERYEFAALDVETTGLYPGGHDRIVEVGIVLFGLDGTMQNEYESLVNPNRDLGPQRIHGISMAELSHAPSFDEISADVIALLRNRIVVAHNSRFDVGFVMAEFERAALHVPELPHICTMRLAARDGLGHRLADVCDSLSIPQAGATPQSVTPGPPPRSSRAGTTPTHGGPPSGSTPAAAKVCPTRGAGLQ